MSPRSQVCRTLDDEHRASLALLGRIEQLLRGAAADGWPKLAAELARHLQADVGRHFDFEEQQLFTRLAEQGDSGMVALLTEEHHAIRDVSAELLPLLGDAAAPPPRALLIELIERQVSHIQKETMALLPMLDELLDEDTDRELAFAYAAG